MIQSLMNDYSYIPADILIKKLKSAWKIKKFKETPDSTIPGQFSISIPPDYFRKLVVF